MNTVTNEFASLVFDDKVMKETLSDDVYAALKKTIDEGENLSFDVANAVAVAMKDWAVEKGATHFTHWFQPLTGVTAEKHDGFIAPSPDGRVIMEFSGKELIKGEPDASSFPSGGLRATFEARGYTAWDPTSYAFIKDKTLCIPTAFCSYGGEALDKKTPLLRSMEALDKQALRVLKLFGNDAKYVRTSVGPEQEYFLVDKDLYAKRKDLIFTGRTLFGAKPPKGQELDDHYFGAIKPRVKEFMADLDDELWKLGVLAKTEHNKVAPAQHELAPIYSTTNVATDHNQLTMEIMQKIALKHGLVCLLHEKPFNGVNGSGKHNNWSLSTDKGVNLLTPGETPYENAQFLLFLSAVIKAVDDYQDLLRLSVASAGNDHRLGANEAPPAVVSIFLGDELTAILDAIENDSPYSASQKTTMKTGVHALPKFPRDTTDRNRTSPFAFTGNKFEFRMVGSSASLATSIIVLDTITAEMVRRIADEIEEKTKSGEDLDHALSEIIVSYIRAHGRIIYNGNNYSKEWVEEAKRRGLHMTSNSLDAFKCMLDKDIVNLYERNGVLSEKELTSRYEIFVENYAKTVNIEALAMRNIARKQILPAVMRTEGKLAAYLKDVREINQKFGAADERLLAETDKLIDETDRRTTDLEHALAKAKSIENFEKQAVCYRDKVLVAMNRLRESVDKLELITEKKEWPFPSYGDILFYE